MDGRERSRRWKRGITGYRIHIYGRFLRDRRIAMRCLKVFFSQRKEVPNAD